MIFATPAELAHYMDPDASTPTVPPLATVLLRSASNLVIQATAAARYPNDEGVARSERIRNALRDAACEQAQAWSINGVDPRKGAASLKPIVTTKALAGASVSYGQSAAIQDAIVKLHQADELVPSAWAILDNAGLISNRVRTGPDWGKAYDATEGILVLGDS